MSLPLKPVSSIAALLVMIVISSVTLAGDEELNQILAGAHAGDAQAQFELAEKYYRGEDIQRNYNEALAWYHKAADQNHAEAQHQLLLVDMVGDGLSDRVRVRNGEVVYWPNLGYGNFGTPVIISSYHGSLGWVNSWQRKFSVAATEWMLAYILG